MQFPIGVAPVVEICVVVPAEALCLSVEPNSHVEQLLFGWVNVNTRVRGVHKAPEEITGFKYLMIWHPRVNTDAAHAWLRSEIRRIGKKIGS
jgi:hypothetical protein